MNDDLTGSYLRYRNIDNEAVQYESDIASARAKDVPFDEGGPDTPPKEGNAINEGINDLGKRVIAPLKANPAIDAFTKIPLYVSRGTLNAAMNIQDTLIGADNVQKIGEFLNKKVPGYKELNDAANSFYQSIGPETEVDKVATEVAQFAIPFMGSLKLMGGIEKGVSKLKTIGAGFSSDFVASFAAMNPDMERFAGLAQELGFENEWVNYLTSRGDSEYEERLKNAIDSSAAGVVLGPVLYFGGKMIKKLYQSANKAKKNAR